MSRPPTLSLQPSPRPRGAFTLVELLVALLNAGVHPVIPEQGSVGASGDLAPLAHLALVAIGEGEAIYKGERISGGEALRREQKAACARRRGAPNNQSKAQRARLRPLAAEGHDPTNRIRAMELAQDYGKTLYTGVFYRNPEPPPSYEVGVKALQDRLQPA